MTTRSTGFSPDGMRLRSMRDAQREVLNLRPDVVHITGPHLWNVPLMRGLNAAGIPVIHTLHDLDPHYGTRFGLLIRLWNQMVIRGADHLLVHGQIYRERLVGMGMPRERITHTPLLHLFLSEKSVQALPAGMDDIEYQRWALFFGRVERYKGLDCLLTACDMSSDESIASPQVVIAGPGSLSGLWAGPLPKMIEVRDRRISDPEALDLFRRCGSADLAVHQCLTIGLDRGRVLFPKTGACNPNRCTAGVCRRRPHWTGGRTKPPSNARSLPHGNAERPGRPGTNGRGGAFLVRDTPDT